MKKTMLIVRACGITDEKQECDNIKTQAEMYGVHVDDYCPKTNEELDGILFRETKQYDYIYLSSHGNDEGFGNEEGTLFYSWIDFGGLLCNTDCMKEECIVMLSCCRGGLNQVAYDLFWACPDISYVVGPRQSLFPHEMLMCFSIFLFNLEHRNIDPIVGCEKIKAVTDIRFVCFDRLETEIEPAYLAKKKEYDELFRQQNGITEEFEVVEFNNGVPLVPTIIEREN